MDQKHIDDAVEFCWTCNSLREPGGEWYKPDVKEREAVFARYHNKVSHGLCSMECLKNLRNMDRDRLKEYMNMARKSEYR